MRPCSRWDFNNNSHHTRWSIFTFTQPVCKLRCCTDMNQTSRCAWRPHAVRVPKTPPCACRCTCVVKKRPQVLNKRMMGKHKPGLSCMIKANTCFYHKGHENCIQLAIVTLISCLNSFRFVFLTTAATCYKVTSKLELSCFLHLCNLWCMSL